MNRPVVVAFGEVLIDEFPDHRVVAGAPLHVAAQLSVRDWEAYVVTRLGGDNDGEWIVETLAELGVGADYVEIDDDLPTGTVTVTMHPGGDHSFTINRPVAWDAIAGGSLPPVVDAFYFGSLAGRDDRSFAALRHLLGATMATPVRAFDVNLRPPDIREKVLRTGLAHATMVKLSSDELETVSGLLAIDGVAGLFAAGPFVEWVCVTSGAAGAALQHRDGGRWVINPSPIEVVDAVGAGDAFTAGLIDALHQGLAPQVVLTTAQQVAEATLRRRGGLPAT